MYISNNRQVTHTTTNRRAASSKKKKSSKKAGKESTSPKKHKSLGQVLGDPRMLKVYGIILLAFSLLLLVSIVSHFFTFGEGTTAKFSKEEINNWAGCVGAFLAYVFVNYTFGIFSIGFTLLFFLYGVKLTFDKSLLPLFGTTVTTLLTMSWLSIVSGCFVSDKKAVLIAGSFGCEVSEWLIYKTGGFVTALILIVLFFAILILCYNVTFRHFAMMGNWIGGLFHREGKEVDNPSRPSKPATEDTHQNLDEYIGKPDGLSQEVGKGTVYEFDEEPKMPAEPVETPLWTPMGVQPKPVAEPVPFEINDLLSTPKQEETPQQEDVDDSFEDGLDIIEDTEGEEQEDSQAIVPLEDYDPRKDLSLYEFPTLDLLNEYEVKEVDKKAMMEELRENKEKIEKTLNNFKIPITKITATIGPTVTLYEIVPDAGIRINKIKGLEDDIALSLAALGIRIIAPIPGKGTIGIEVPNKNPKIVSMREILASDKFQNNKFDLPMGLGKTISDEPFVVDLAKMPHLLIAGATGQGKSVGLNAIITSLLYKKHPSELKFVMVDPKKVEFTLYSILEKHFLAELPDADEPISTDTKKVVRTLNSLCVEMDARYDLLKQAKTRNIKEYNAKFCSRKLSPANGHRYMPYIVVIIDEFGDLIITAGREVETPLTRLAQLARAIGIHLVIATQRPTVNIITGSIKANFPARIAFRVQAGVDSKTILDATGANQLIGKGDMLISTGSDMVRLQCAFVDTPEVEKITNFISDQQAYPEPFYLPEYAEEESDFEFGGEGEHSDKIDSCFMDAATLIVQTQQGSTSLIQRKMSLGYNRAGRIMDQLEEFNIVGPSMGSKAREVKVHSLEELRVIFQQMGLI